ncbi:MAG: tetratricopeptide repeat protein [Opitutaceae bacterium]|nr:tetratricopeptide repeat protein [Opitutaceae bacterium]
MVVSVTLTQLSLLLGRDFLSLPENERLQSVGDVFRFLGKVTGVEIRDNVVVVHAEEAPAAKATEASRLADRAARRAREGDYARAVEQLRRALELNPGLQPAHRELAMCLMELGQHAAAKDALIDALKLDATDAWSFVVLGNLYAKHEKDFARARAFFERALQLKPGDAWALNALATALAESGDPAAALLRFDEAIAANADFPNAWLGKAVLLQRTGHPAEAAATARALFARAQPADARAEPVFAEAAKLFLSATGELAHAAESDAFKAVEDYRRTVERESGYPVEVVEGELPAHLAAQVQAAWKHGRDRSVIVVRKSPPPQPSAPPLTSHLVAHELTHLRLEAAARSAGRNRFFATTAATHAAALRSLGHDLRRLESRGLRPDAVARLARQLIAGVCELLFNCPLDLLIERRLDTELPALRPLQLLSLARLAAEARTSTLHPEVRRITPPRILRAASALNGAHALLLDSLSGGATRCWPAYRVLETAALSEKLWRHWSQRAPGLTPGGEYDLVDEFADLVGLRGWYEWQTDPGDQATRATATGSDPTPEGTTNPELLRAKHPAAVWFLLDALQRYARLPADDVRKIALEIAVLGREGLDYADPEKKYSLHSLPGENFSGLQAMCLMFAAFKQVAPEHAVGMELEEPFLTALELFQQKEESA